MTRSDVVALLSERGVLEVARSVAARYHRGELPLDAAARRLATILRAARDWKVQHGQPLRRTLWIKALSKDQVTNPWSPMLALWSQVRAPEPSGSLNLWPPLPLGLFSLARDVASTPLVRNPNPDDVYDEAVRINALLDAVHTWHQRWIHAAVLYDEVARLVHEAA